MELRESSLRHGVIKALLILVTLMSLTAGSLVGITSVLHQTTQTLTASVETVRIAKDAQRDLLLHSRAREPMTRGERASDLRRHLADAGGFVTTPDEQKIFEHAQTRVSAYLQSPTSVEQERLEPAAFEALGDLVQVNIAQADDAQKKANRLDVIANAVGIVTAVFMISGAVALGLWVRGRVLRPILGLADAIRRFGLGKESIRAPEDGPEELRDIARQFNTMAERLAEQRTAHRTYLAAVAHDLRNPLNTLRLAVDAVPTEATLDRSRLDRVVSIVRRQTTRLTRLADDLLDTANLSAGRLDLRLGPCDVREVARSTVELFTGSSAKHDVELAIPEMPAVVTCDPQRLEQVLANLVGNAIKYSPGGGTVRVSVESTTSAVEIAVADEGVGMTPEEIERVFQPYTRAETLREAVPGHGLGLFIAQRIVDEHGGTLAIESKPNGGSVFRVALPRDVLDAQPTPLH
jgi:two-component system sensor histidine kinase MtrB